MTVSTDETHCKVCYLARCRKPCHSHLVRSLHLRSLLDHHRHILASRFTTFPHQCPSPPLLAPCHGRRSPHIRRGLPSVHRNGSRTLPVSSTRCCSLLLTSLPYYFWHPLVLTFRSRCLSHPPSRFTIPFIPYPLTVFSSILSLILCSGLFNYLLLDS